MANWNGHFILTVFGDFYPALNGNFRPPLTSQPGSCDNYLLAFLCGLDYTDNIIEFIPEKAGQYTYSCWMGMLRNTITVLEDE